MTLPSKQDDGNVREQPLCARLWSACVVAYVENGYKWWFCGVVLSDVRPPLRTMSLALSFDLGTALSRSTALYSSSHQTHSPVNSSRDSGDLRLAVLAGSASWPRRQSRRSSRRDMPSYCQRRSRLIGDPATFTRLARIGRLTRICEPRAPSLHLWTAPSAMSGRTFSNEKLVDPVGDICLSISPSQASTWLNDSLSATS